VNRWEVPDDGGDPHRDRGDDGTVCPADPGDPIELPITDVIDLHSFRPVEVADVVREYLDAAYAKGLRGLRIIHGRGIGVQRRTVRVVLERDPRVVSFGDAAPEAGGWGATWVRLR
jgi:dsDNA-specific endonuclease/ATPase MutS2